MPDIVTRNRVLPWVMANAVIDHNYPSNKQYLDHLFTKAEQDRLGTTLLGIHAAWYKWKRVEMRRRELEARRQKKQQQRKPAVLPPVETRPLEEALTHALNAIAEVEVAAKALLTRHEQLRKLLEL